MIEQNIGSKMTNMINEIDKHIAKAVSHYWTTRKSQTDKQKKRGVKDAGLRGAVTGGAQMDGFIDLFKNLIEDTGIDSKYIHKKTKLELPGFFRPTKEWDLLVVKEGKLIAAIEAKSQVGPSFGNNFNNRTEEAMGTALDLWTAFRKGAFNEGVQPFLGYFFMLEDCDKSNQPVKVREPHFKVFPEFVNASYMKRYELFCRKLILERHYTAAAFITSTSSSDINGSYKEPAKNLSFKQFSQILISHVGAHV